MQFITRRRAIIATIAISAFTFAAPPAVSGQRASVPAPESVFGFMVGADGKLFDYEQSIGYFRRLAAENQHVRVIDVGRDGVVGTVVCAVGNLRVFIPLRCKDTLTTDCLKALAKPTNISEQVNKLELRPTTVLRSARHHVPRLTKASGRTT